MIVNFTIHVHIDTDDFQEDDIVDYILARIEKIQQNEEENDYLVDYIINTVEVDK
jgi:hypothetical protein